MRWSVASPEVPCARCGRRVEGLAWGNECAVCLEQRRVRASHLAGRISLPATLLVGIYLWLRMPHDSSFRVYGGLTMLVTYFLVRQIVSRVAMEVFSREPRNGVQDADR
jgi:hypothetical protein